MTTFSRRCALALALSSCHFAACSSGGNVARAPSSTNSAGSTGSGGAAINSAGSTGSGGVAINILTGATGGSDGAGLGVGCAAASMKATLVPANLLFIVDRSGSMNCNLPPTTSSADCENTPARASASLPSKWEIIRDSLKSALAPLPTTTSAGITYFSNDNACGVQSKPNVELKPLDAAQLDALGASLDAVKPKGGTPMVGALVNAYKRFNPNQVPDQPLGNKFVVLLTDGTDSCNSDEVSRLLETEVPKAVRAHIRTFVVGAPGSEQARSVLSRLAYNGGTATRDSCDHSGISNDVGDCHFDMTEQPDFAHALVDALAVIGGQALSCEVDVPSADGSGGAVDLNKVNVQYVPADGADPIPIYQDPSKPCDGGADGWQYSSDRSKIVVCGPSCDRVRAASRIDIVLGCAIVIK